MSPDQIVAFVLAPTAPAAVDPVFPRIAAGGADPRCPVTSRACPRSFAPGPAAVVQLHAGPGVGIVARAFLTSAFLEHPRTRRDGMASDQRGVDLSALAETRCLDTLGANPDTVVRVAQGLGDTVALTHRTTPLVRTGSPPAKGTRASTRPQVPTPSALRCGPAPAGRQARPACWSA